MKYQCPVCLNDTLNEPYTHYSYEICLMCGVEFGFDDAINENGWTKKDWLSKADTLIAANHTKLRQIWVDAGSKSWLEETKHPEFEGGVSWFNDYWETHPEECDEWQESLASIFKNTLIKR